MPMLSLASPNAPSISNGGELGGGFGGLTPEPAQAKAQLGMLFKQYKPGINIQVDTFNEMLRRNAQAAGITDLDATLKEMGISFGKSATGGYTFVQNPDGSVKTPENGGQPAGTGAPAPSNGKTTTGGPSFTSPPTGGGSSGVQAGGGGWGGGGGFTPAESKSSGGMMGGGAPPGISWTDPIGFKNPGAGPGPTGASYGTGFSYGRPRSIFDGLPSNPTMGDIVGKTIQRNEDNRDAALGVLGNTRSEIQSDPNRVALRSRTADLLANPYSMDEATISRILGKTNEGLTQRAAEQQGMVADRNAALGMGRSGSAAASSDAIRANTSGQMAGAERDTRVQAAIQNGQDLRSAMATAGQAVGEETNAKMNVDRMAAIDTIGGSNYSGDAFLSQAMLAAPKKQQNNTGGSMTYG